MPEGRSVQEVLTDMAEAVRRGEMKQAAHLAQTAVVPLAVQPVELGMLGAPGGSGTQLIAKGAQGQVLRSRWNGKDVAVKVPRLGTTADMDRFRKEVALMASLGGPHTHIMPLLGARCLPPHYLLVMPLAGHSLAHCMYVAAPAWRPGWAQVLSVGVQLARALATMHEAGVVHRDMKPDNVLLQRGSGPDTLGPVQVYLSDLGLACHVEDLQASTERSTWSGRGRMARPTGGFHKQDAVGTQEYCAPELLMHSAPHSPASDVFALAVTLNELTTLTPPYSDCTREGPPGLHTVLDTGYTRQQLAAAVAGEGLRPRPPMGPTLPGWQELLDAAWATEPAQRPSAAQLLSQLEHLAGVVLPAWEAGRAQPGLTWRGHPDAASAGDMEVDMAGAGGGLVSDMVSRPAGVGCSNSSSRTDLAALRARQYGGSSTCLTCSNSSSSDGEAALVPGPPVPGAPRADVVVMVSPGCGAGKAEAGKAAAAAGAAQGEDAWAAAMCKAGACVWDFARGTCTSIAAPPSAAPAAAPVVSAGVVEAVGNRDTWEDRSVVEAALPVQLPPSCPRLPRVSLLAVFDGHRGAEAAELCKLRAPALVAEQLAAAAVAAGQAGAVEGGVVALPGQKLAGVVHAVLLQLEQEVFAWWDGERRAAAARAAGVATATDAGAPSRLTYPGCTATLALLVGSTLMVGNLGDGQAVLGGITPPLRLTRPHTAAEPYERARLAAAGVPPVWHAQGGGWRLPGCGLQVTRSIGDYDAKGLQPTPRQPPAAVAGGMARGTGLTAEPEVCQLQLQAHHTWLVLGSDGLWDVLAPDAVHRFVADTVKQPAMSARRLVAEALDAGSDDNITAVVAFLQPVTTLERVFTAAAGAADGQ